MFDFWQLRGNGCRMLPMSSKKPEEMARWNSCGMSICSNCWFARNRFFLTSQYYIIVVNNAQQHLEPCHQHALNGFDLPEEDIHGHSACTKCQQCHTVSTYIALINKLPSAAKCCQVLPEDRCLLIEGSLTSTNPICLRRLARSKSSKMAGWKIPGF